MGPVSGIVVYLCIWWVVIFCVLPIGIERDETGKPDFSSGAPKDPKIKQKFILTTLISAVLWLAVFAMIHFGVIDFRHDAEIMNKIDYN